MFCKTSTVLVAVENAYVETAGSYCLVTDFVVVDIELPQTQSWVLCRQQSWGKPEGVASEEA